MDFESERKYLSYCRKWCFVYVIMAMFLPAPIYSQSEIISINRTTYCPFVPFPKTSIEISKDKILSKNSIHILDSLKDEYSELGCEIDTIPRICALSKMEFTTIVNYIRDYNIPEIIDSYNNKEYSGLEFIDGYNDEEYSDLEIIKVGACSNELSIKMTSKTYKFAFTDSNKNRLPAVLIQLDSLILDITQKYSAKKN